MSFNHFFPTTSGAFQEDRYRGGGGIDAFVAKFNPLASGAASLIYSTRLGGNNNDNGLGIAVDALGNAYVTGYTLSTNFPTTPGAFQNASGGSTRGDFGDAFLAKLGSTGSMLLYSTYLGGSSDEIGRSIAIDAESNAYVTGDTLSNNFPTTSGAFQPTHGDYYDAFVSKLTTATKTLSCVQPPSNLVSWWPGDGVNFGEPVTLTGLSASLNTSTLSVGSHTITAEYNGDNNFASSTASLAQRVNPKLFINDVSVKEGDAGTTSADFSVSLSAPNDQPVTVNFTTVDGTAKAGKDYNTNSGMLTFNPGESTKTISVIVNGDILNEPDETFFVLR